MFEALDRQLFFDRFAVAAFEGKFELEAKFVGDLYCLRGSHFKNPNDGTDEGTGF
ncbi:hypothetical protein [Pseudomonas frederiksbergensis]|uniref:hypothetical protein n=1 Tax=Pseudomonas frederiksbergensis TaxID=104087 RepID=UPI003D218D95